MRPHNWLGATTRDGRSRCGPSPERELRIERANWTSVPRSFVCARPSRASARRRKERPVATDVNMTEPVYRALREQLLDTELHSLGCGREPIKARPHPFKFQR